MIGRAICLLLGHRWEPHPDFDALNRRRENVRLCDRCCRVESRALRAGLDDWWRMDHLERRR